MRGKSALTVVGLAGLLAFGCSTNPRPSLVPPQITDMNAKTLERFLGEVDKYVLLRRSVVAHLRAATANSSAAQVSTRQRDSTEAVVLYRRGKKRGNIFTRDVEVAIRRTLGRAFSGVDGPALIKGVEQGNPMDEGSPSPSDPSQDVKSTMILAVNAIYPDAAPASSVPPSLLLTLPPLPPEVRYCFIGRALILRDSEANVILDFIPNVVPGRTLRR